MKKVAILMMNLLLSLGLNAAYAYQTKVVQSNGLVFWTESFGQQDNPAILLIMGSGGQGLLWPESFCEGLAKKGYYVIRYDNRDTGLSSAIDYKTKPYNLLDLAKDTVGILDQYGITKAHVVGTSMGGEVAMLLAAHYPKHVRSLSLIATTIDMRPFSDSFQGKLSNSPLSKPDQIVLDAAQKVILNPPKTLEEKVNNFVENMRLNQGSLPFDEALAQQLALQSMIRMQNPDGPNNHFLAIQSSYELHEKAPSEITTATLILHGDKDQIFPLDHAHAVNRAIRNSKLVIIPGMGHGLINSNFYGHIINKIDDHSKNH